MLYAVLALLLLVLPGLSIATLAGIRRQTFLISVSLSYALFVLLLNAAQRLEFSIPEFSLLYFSFVALLIGTAVVMRLVIPALKGNRLNNTFNNLLEDNKSHVIGSFVITVLLSCYYFYAGVYLELPSDIYQHMEYVQTISRQIDNSTLYGTSIPAFYLQFNGKYWHYFYALTNSWIGADVSKSLAAASFTNNLLFLLGVFSFSIVVFKRFIPDARSLLLVSMTVCLLTFLHFGVSIFSFVRYYAMAPVMLNLILYFTIMAIVIRFFQEDGWPVKEIVLAAVIAYAGLYIHIQEVLFAVVMVLLMSGYLFIRDLLSSKIWVMRSPGSADFSWKNVFLSKPSIVFILLALSTVLLHVYSLLNVKRNPIDEPKLISLGEFLPFSDNLYILNPAYQFYQVVGIWGLLVIFLFYINWKTFRGNAYLVAGMLSPLFTVFNPLFVDLFLRHSHSIMLWRLSFLVPIYLVGGYLLYKYFALLRSEQRWRSIQALITITALVLFLLPIKLPVFDLPTSKLYTLHRVDADASPQHWQDLLDYLDTIKERRLIITDPVTGYMVTALTRHNSPRYKFHRAWGGYVNFSLDDYSNHPFDRYAGRLLIINRRSGAMSETGRLGRHWPEMILQVDTYYDNHKLDEYIAAQPDRFELLWDSDRIQVYKIRVRR